MSLLDYNYHRAFGRLSFAHGAQHLDTQAYILIQQHWLAILPNLDT
jgi:hypothetical protein